MTFGPSNGLSCVLLTGLYVCVLLTVRYLVYVIDKSRQADFLG